MAREWKPGDDIPDSLSVVVAWNGTALGKMLAVLKEDYLPGYRALADDIRIAMTRPLVVVDPEDREQVERLGSAIFGAGNVSVPALTDALRQFADPKPPKPEEPTGLGAVVEDAEGERWMRHEYDPGRIDRRHAWYPAGHVQNGVRLTWDDIAVVRVLSEGVQA